MLRLYKKHIINFVLTKINLYIYFQPVKTKTLFLSYFVIILLNYDFFFFTLPDNHNSYFNKSINILLSLFF